MTNSATIPVPALKVTVPLDPDALPCDLVPATGRPGSRASPWSWATAP